MQICIVSTQLCYILMQKEWHFNFKKWDVKTRDFASEWRKSRFRGLKISNFSGGGYPGPPYGRVAFGAIFLRTPYAENLDPCQDTIFFAHWLKVKIMFRLESFNLQSQTKVVGKAVQLNSSPF